MAAAATARAGDERACAAACDPVFLDWCRANGVQVHGVAPAFVADGWRGVVATRAIGPGDVLVAVPVALLVTGRSARRDPVLGQLLQQPEYVKLSDHQVLAAHLLHEASKGAASFWDHYIRQLPRGYSTLCCFPPAAAEALQLPYAVNAARDAEAKAKAEWRGAWPLLQDLGMAKKWSCWGAWQWATSTVLSRTMYFPNDLAGALTPFGDLFNYRAPPAPYIPRLHLPKAAAAAAAIQQSSAPCGSLSAQGVVCEGPGAAGSDGPADAEGPPGSDAAVGVAEQGCHAQHHEQQEHGQQPWEQQQHEQQPQRGCSPSAGGSGGGGASGSPSSGPAEAGAAALAAGPEAVGVPGGAVLPSGGAGTAAAGTALADAAARLARVGLGPGPAGLADGPRGEEEGGASGGSVEGPEGGDEERAAGCGDGAYDAVARAYKLYSWARYEPGEQVFLCYGRHNNLELLELYGFCLPPGDDPGSNPHDAAFLPPDLFAACCRREPPLAADCWLHWDGRPSWELLRVLRVNAAAPDELRGAGHRVYEGRAVSREGDARCAAWLHAACARQLASLPTRLQDDERELARLRAEGAAAAAAAAAGGGGGTAAAECLRLAVEWRVGYKRILQRGSAIGL